MPLEEPPPLDRQPVTERRVAYRFVHVDNPDEAASPEDFRSDRESGKNPLRREKVYPELCEGMSFYGSLEAARAVWQTVYEAATAREQAVRMGNHVAEVVLMPEQGYYIEDLREPDEHLTIWGDKDQLAAAVRRIHPALINSE